MNAFDRIADLLVEAYWCGLRETIDDWIDAWHDTPEAAVPLHVWLGWSWLEYKAFVETGDVPEREHRR